MQQTRTVELGTGLFVFLGVVALLFLTTQTTGLDGVFERDHYRVTARFDNIGGLTTRAPVTMAGVTIGRVESIEFDPVRLNAQVTMRIDSRYDQIPSDSGASIQTAGLLGGQYVGLSPGGSFESLTDGDQIFLTQSALVLENLINQLIFQLTQGNN